MREVELKFELAPEAHGAFRKLPALANVTARRTRLHALYFDTPDFQLRSREMALRLRRSGKRWTQTLKSGRSGTGGLHSRDEWEFDRPGPALDLTLFKDTPLSKETDLANGLGEVFQVDVRRTSWEVEVSPGNRVEVALDRGEVRRGEAHESVSEVEIESLAGDPMAVFELADRLLEPAGLRPSAVTKAQRGYRLARGEPTQPARSREVELDPAASPAQAARALAGAALEQIQANEDGVLARDGPEYLHQLRVGLRRLRSALKVFRARDALPADTPGELRWIASLTAPARDWDVLATATLPSMLAAYGDDRVARSIRARIGARRKASHDALRDAMRSPRYARLMLALARWLSESPPVPDQEGGTLVGFARKVIDKRQKRLVSDAGRLSSLTTAERHALRLDAKRLRYALDGMASLFRPRRVEACLASLSEIQDDLGRANDAAVAQRLLAEVKVPAPFAQFARGWFAAEAHASAAGLERHALRLSAVKKLKPREATRA
jgi:inorganic triphosphatase YgiF